MKRILAIGAAAATIAYPAWAASAEMSADEARERIAPFYRALNAQFAGESAALIRQVTAPGWTSCRGNEVCNTRDEVIAGVAQRVKSIPNLRWEIKDVLVSGNQIAVRGEASGTPAGEFMGAAYAGKSFKVMSIDIHAIEGGKMVRSYHIEDWLGAVRQLNAN